MPSGLAVAASSATPGDIAVPVYTKVLTGQPGVVAAADKAKPVGSAGTGPGSSAMTAQSPRAPLLAPATNLKDIEPPGETAERAIRESCPE
eukprot:6928884-Pyramimonas_sp.AAC.1